MKEKIKNEIIEILKENPGLESHLIGIKLEENGYELTYDTIQRYLKNMTQTGILTRLSEGRKKYEDNIKHWNYHYYATNEGVKSVAK